MNNWINLLIVFILLGCIGFVGGIFTGIDFQKKEQQQTIKQVNLLTDRAYYLGWYRGFERGYDAGYLRKYTDIQMESEVKHLFYQYDSTMYNQALDYMDITKTLNFDEE